MGKEPYHNKFQSSLGSPSKGFSQFLVVLIKLDGYMYKNENRSILIILHKTQVQVNQRLQHKIKYNELDRRESKE